MQQSAEIVNITEQRDAIVSRIRSVRDIPTLPHVIYRINQIVSSRSTKAKEISEIINRDQGLAMNVLRQVNSAYYGFRGQVQNIDRAIIILGFERIRNIAFSLSVVRLFKTTNQDFDFDGFWKYSVGVGVMSELLAAELGNDKENSLAEDAMIAGLLHDIGKLVLALYFSREYKNVLFISEREGKPSFLVEREVLGIDHAEVGGVLANYWDLPETLCLAISNHVEPVRSASSPQLEDLVHLSQFLVDALMVGNAWEKVLSPVNEEVWNLFGLEREDLDRIFAMFSQKLKEAYELFGIGHG